MGEERYLSNRENYEIVQGTVTYIFYSDEEKRFYVALEGLPERYYNGFTLLGDNFSIAKENGLYEKVQIGTAVVLETAPKYFYDGYQYPIIALQVGDDVLLDGDTGIQMYKSSFSILPWRRWPLPSPTWKLSAAFMELAGGVGPTITSTTRPGSMYDGDEGGNETLPPVVDEEVPDETIPPEMGR